MIAPIILALCAFAVSLLTFFSGFGLGTLLMPVFSLWFPISLAIAMTALVHLANNLFKFMLTFRHVDRAVAVRFGVPAMLSALLGAWLLTRLADVAPLVSYELGGRVFHILPLKVIVAVLLIVFTVLDLTASLEHLSLGRRYLSIGGVLSGFFGGLSGHQGALRSAVLAHLKLPKESFVATGTLIACAIDVARLSVYLPQFQQVTLWEQRWVLVPVTLSAFGGALLGTHVLKKVTMRTLQRVVAVAVALFALALGLGWA